MKILFVYPNHSSFAQTPLGIAYLSAVAKANGHKTDLIDLTFGWNKKETVKKIQNFKPDLIAFSIMSTIELEYSNTVANFIKSQFDIPICIGGAHATMDPESSIVNDATDIVAVGEAEETFIEMITNMEERKDISDISGLWVKKDGKIIRNPIRPLNQNLDEYPFPDRKLFDKKHTHKPYGSAFITSRGCPYQCSYCGEQFFQKIYNYKNFVRYRSIENVMQEMEEAVEKEKIKNILLVDDTFTIKKERVLEFCREYERRIGIPFVCKTNPNSVNRELMFVLKAAGCSAIMMGVESGNDYIRMHVMNRHFPKENIIRAFKWAHEAGMKTYSYNMVGLPEETRRTVFDGIELNKIIKPSWMQVSIFYPLPGTELWRVCKEKNFISNRKTNSYFEDSVLNLPTISRREIIALQRTFQLYVKFPKAFWFVPFALEKLIKYSPETTMKFYQKLLEGINMPLFWFHKSEVYDSISRKLMSFKNGF